MRNIQYWRGDEMLGTDLNMGEYRNDAEDGRCPFCHEKVETVICRETEWEDEEGNLWVEDRPIGCFHCIDSFEDCEDGYYYDGVYGEYVRDDAYWRDYYAGEAADWEISNRLSEEGRK